MRKEDEYDFDDKPSVKGSILVGAAAIAVTLLLIAVVFFVLMDSGEEAKPGVIVGESVSSESKESMEIPSSSESASTEKEGYEPEQNTPEIPNILIGDGPEERDLLTKGIDVSKYQGNIDWQQVAQSGIDFAMIRVGYRAMESGEITEDGTAKYNLQEATGNGIKTGAYFFSTAVSEAEAIEEAKWVVDFIDQYKITYPVAYNCEGFDNTGSRQYNLTKEERTNIAKAFLNEIHKAGYTPMFYASKGEMEADSQWIASSLEKSYKIWVSWYPEHPYPETPEASYQGSHDMWQYTNAGKMAGIETSVDVNVAYFGYDQEALPKDSNAPERVEADVEWGHGFREVNETVTAKDATNLRDIPGQGEDSKVVLTLKNGETAVRTGISESGWSRVEYNGNIYYAVSSLLTTDLTVKAPDPTPEPDDGIKTEFAVRDEKVSPKMEVNLRTLPSVTNPDSVVVVTLPYGSVVRRTGINEDVGWSRVEYEGQTLYCVSSYVYVAE